MASKFGDEIKAGKKAPRIVIIKANILFPGVRVGSVSGAIATQLTSAPTVIAPSDRFRVGA